MSIHLFTGNDHQALQEKLGFWEREFVKKHGEANLEKFEDLRQEDISRIIAAFETAPFLGEKRMVIIRGLPASTEKTAKIETDTLEEALKAASETAVIIFVSPVPDKRSRLYKTLVKLAGVESFSIPESRELGPWIEQSVRAKGKRITPGARDLLMLFTSQDVTKLPGEIEKLSLLDQETITEDMIGTFVSPTPEAKIFQMLDLIGTGSSLLVRRSLEQLARSGGEMMMIFSMIVRQFRLLIQVRDLMEKGNRIETIQRRLKIAPFQATMLTRQAKNFSPSQLRSAHTRLADIDLQIKTGKIPLSSGQDDFLHLRIDQLLCSLTE